ncbi:type IV secretion system DNA-binding domain-containing protein [Novosphingobium resinovorum]|uniref:Conjugal transfer protein TraD n=1 Tax=Novosphingobium resinovorum TaxID=158500 RepID=A0A031JRJ3_9SPHN|nr:type IV secretion system DNA-binding domain-containing protein [Novosphingobium resinovorum]AOR81118.1 conjugal transfer protein TraD [Novosphingobium resinovorum]EZP77820.1 Type IV secretory protein VirD4 [Novosphingobium resinovorum]
MARKDGKKDREDIRDDGRPVPLKHHSARGDTPRNNGNFVRGSQLLNTQVIMWLQGAKMPFLMWLGMFALSYFTILSFTLDENNFQLICMRVLSWLWDWCALDPMKQANLQLPDHTVRHTFMGYVPYVPEVALAWHKAMRGIIGSALIASFATIPSSIWYVDFSRRRGGSIMEERHERGAMLVDRDLLYKEISQHNQTKFVEEAKDLFPDLSAKGVLALPFAARKAAGIHHPYHIAGIPYPHRLEQSHTMLLGTTGTGKTTVLRKHLEQMREREDNAVVFDLTGAYVEAFYHPERDTILNPMDVRCPAWSIFNDCQTYSEFTAAAAALIPSDGGSSEPFWALAARTLFIEMCMKLIEKGQTSNQALADNLMTADLKQVHRHLQKTIADPLTAPEAARMAESIRAVFNTNAQALRFLPDDGKPYSIKQWITGDKAPGSILFITCTYTDLEMNKALLTLWSNLAIHSLMTMKKTRSLRTWFMFDELGALHRLPAIEDGLQTARNFGGAMILGLHSFDKLVQVYGEENARNLSSLARTKLMLAAADLDTAEQCARYIGNREIRQMDEGYSYGYNSTRDASTLTPRKQIEPLVIPDDIMNLPSMHGFVKFPDGFPAARVRLQWQQYPQVAEGFIRRPPNKPDDPDGKVRGGGGKPKGGDDGGRGEYIALSDEEMAARDAPIALAANILSQPSEQDREAQEGRDPNAREALDRMDPGASHSATTRGEAAKGDAVDHNGLDTPERSGIRSNNAVSIRDDQEVASRSSHRDVEVARASSNPLEKDLGVREARDAGVGTDASQSHHHDHPDLGDSGIGMGD